VATRRVLVVEDDPGIAGVLRRGLALHGLEVDVALDGTDGRAAWATGTFDLVVLDVMLPGVDGVDLLAERRAAGDLTPVILLTARDDDRVRARGLAVGADAFVVKPFAYTELVGLIDRLGSRSISPSDSTSGA
jgi:two-component system copper resistance phosphate regulon response regulator CusR